jgi:hypothetical protein
MHAFAVGGNSDKLRLAAAAATADVVRKTNQNE